MDSTEELVFLPLGGVGEIGMNVALYGFGPPRQRQWIMVDCGVTFGDPASTPGVELILPDIRFAESLGSDLLGLVLTHAHEDHYGAVLDLWPRLKVPVFATPFTAGLLAAKAAGEQDAPKVPVTLVPTGGRVQIGPFDVTFVPVAHSIPEPHSLAIRTPAGLVVHTGDWKIDTQPPLGIGTRPETFRALGEEGVLAVIGDSTNAVRDGRSPSETEVAATLAELVRTAPARVAVTTFASHVARAKSIAEAAFANGREVVVVGRALHRTITVAREAGLLDGVPQFHGPDAYRRLPPEKVVVLLTGSQGEARAALSRIAANDHPEVTLGARDRLIFSSRTIPGNERPVNHIINTLIDRGIEVITDRTDLVHVSGHPRREEMAELYGWLRPQTVVPVHGEALHLSEHLKLAAKLGINAVGIRNGDMLRLWPGTPQVIGKAPVGRVFKDGRLRVAGDEITAERRRLAAAGVVSVAIALDSRGELLADPEVEICGIPLSSADGAAMTDVIYDTVERVLSNLPRAKRRDPDAVEDTVARALRAKLRQVWGKKPLCQILVIGV